MISFLLLQKISFFKFSQLTFSHTVELCSALMEDDRHKKYFLLAFFTVSQGIVEGSIM